MSTVIRFEAHAPAGRAIQHLLDTVLAEHVDRTIHVDWSGGDTRRLVVHPSLGGDVAAVTAARTADTEDIAGGLIMLIESLAGTGAVNLNQLYAIADDDQREHIALAVFMAAGYQVGATAGKRRAS